MDTLARGSCLCGALRFQARLPSLWVAHCHCSRCQRAHGSAFVTWAGFPASAVAIDADGQAPAWYASSPGARRGFCPRCGSPMFFESSRWPGETHIARAVIDGPLDRPPGAHVFYDSHVPWVDTGDALPRHGDSGEDDAEAGHSGGAPAAAALPAQHAAFWAAAERADPALDRARLRAAFAFGDDAAMADALAALVLHGAKRATASLLWAHLHDGERLPAPGDLAIVTSSNDEALCLLETTAVEVLPFDQVGPDFARAEGEGDGSLADWRQAHQRFFARECRRIGRTPAADMPVVCERFRVAYPPERPHGG